LQPARRRLPMVEVAGATALIGERRAVTLLDVFEGRRMLIAYCFMWHTGHPASEQCEGCGRRPKKWTMPIHHWREALNHFTILWPERMPALERIPQ